MSSEPAIALTGISKRFGPVAANRDVSLSVAAGSIHGIVGENGAGKSTLMSILYGFYTADSGEIRVNGTPHAITDSRHALALGQDAKQNVLGADIIDAHAARFLH